jgi:hypothetical protein
VTSFLAIVGPLVAAVVNCLGYIFTRRLFGIGLASSIIAGLSFGLVAVAAWCVGVIWSDRSNAVDLAVSQIGTYLGLSFCFWAFLNLNITSLRIRILRQLLHAGGSMPMSELLAGYPESERLQRRLSRLQNGGQIVLVDGKWRIRSSPVLMLAKSIDVIRKIMGQG